MFENYRHIAILTVLHKVIERFMAKHLNTFLIENDIVGPSLCKYIFVFLKQKK